jgi:hypothetical protein
MQELLLLQSLADTEQVNKISYSNTALSTLRASAEWKELINKAQIDTRNITRTYYTNASVSVVTIPILGNTSDEDYFNIYVKGNKFVITKVHVAKLPNGNTEVGVRSPDDNVYYQFEFNTQNKIGNWKIGNTTMPVKQTFSAGSSAIRMNAEPPPPGGCSDKPFMACMDCLIIGVCGSSWVCAIACGVFIPSCVGGAAAVCVLA